MKEKKNKKELTEETTKDGEFIASYFGWVTPKEQKKKVKELENITKK